jgi:hypothetical protein
MLGSRSSFAFSESPIWLLAAIGAIFRIQYSWVYYMYIYIHVKYTRICAKSVFVNAIKY